MLFDIDWQGARQVRERLGDDVVSNLRAAALDAGSFARDFSAAPKDSLLRRSTSGSRRPGTRSSVGAPTIM